MAICFYRNIPIPQYTPLHPHLLSDFTQMVSFFRHHTQHILYPFEQAIYLFLSIYKSYPIKKNQQSFSHTGSYIKFHLIISYIKPYHNITSSPYGSFGHTTSSFNFLHQIISHHTLLSFYLIVVQSQVKLHTFHIIHFTNKVKVQEILKISIT